MKTLYKDTLYNLEIGIVDEIGDFVSGLTILYEIKKSSDNSFITSGQTTETHDIYSFSYSFSETGEYRLKYLTPTNYENGFEQIFVIDDIMGDIRTDIKYVLGLNQSNFRIKDQIYNSDNLLLSSTIRIYNNSTDTNNDINHIKEYNMSAIYDEYGRLLSYKVVESNE